MKRQDASFMRNLGNNENPYSALIVHIIGSFDEYIIIFDLLLIIPIAFIYLIMFAYCF